MCLQVLVTKIKMIVAEEPPIGTQRTGMSRTQDTVPSGIYQRSLLAGRSSPQHEYQALTFTAQRTDYRIREYLPSMPAMAESLMLPYTQAGVQQEHTLLGPSGKVTALWHGSTRFRLYLLEDILQRGRELHAVIHAEAQSVRLTGLMVRVLTKYYHPHLVKGRSVKGIEYQPPGG